MEAALETNLGRAGQAGTDILARRIVKSTEGFLERFTAALRADGNKGTAGFLTQFLIAADRFNDQCSQAVAAVVLEHSKQPEVRGSSESTLIRLIRSRCFETLDLILEDYAGFVAQVETEFPALIRKLTESRLRQALLNSNNPEAKKVKRFKLPTAAKEAALEKILEFVQNIPGMADGMVDYGFAKLHGESGNHEESSRMALMVRGGLEISYNEAVAALESCDIIKRKRWEAQYASESAALQGLVAASSMKTDARKSRVGALALSFLFGLPVFYIWSAGPTNMYIGAAVAASALVALICLLRGISAVARSF